MKSSSSNKSTGPDEASSTSGRTTVTRRSFVKRILAAGAAANAVGLALAPSKAGAATDDKAAADNASQRRMQAYRIRQQAALLEFNQPLPTHPNNGDEVLYPNKIGNYSKGLPHNELGEVDLDAYGALLTALASGRREDFEAIPLGLGARLANPQSGLAFELEGPDSHALFQPPAPALASAEAASELAELYWMALARDVHFADYGASLIIAAAAADLSRFSDFRAPRIGGRVTPETVFRGNTLGDLPGPYLSQFLWLDIPQGTMLVPQKLYTSFPGLDYMTDYNEWLAIQNGAMPLPYQMDPTPRYIRNLRDLGEWAHFDALYQAYHQACLILMGLFAVPGQRDWFHGGGAPVAAGNPYRSLSTTAPFGTFGGPHVLSLVTEVATRALKAVWYQKWYVHRRLRPEAMGGLVHQTITGMAQRPIHSDLLNSGVLGAVYSSHGSYLLPVAMPEGSPTHPSYGAGHATVAGACVTILKAWFDETTVIPHPVVPNADGTALLPWVGPPLTVGNELNKLAANVAQGRNALGIHDRSDYWESLKLGEAVAIGILEDQKNTYNEGGAWTFTRFDGTVVTI
ncbi:MAG: vanadium-dependent haloperoxidase [Verrucomicrobia subdivision 3 bacterium]|nr:vanadium-dependent haloperoxidase [Limisphaerales bacterium]